MSYTVETLDNFTYKITEFAGGSAYMYLLVGAQRAMLIDSGFGTIPLDVICAGLTQRPVFVVLTHGHADHIGGCGLFAEVWLHRADLPLYRSNSKYENRRRFAQEPLFPVKEQPSLFDGEPVFDLGGREVRVWETPGHTLGSISLLDAERRWLYAGDNCCRAHVLLQLEYSAGLAAYRNSMAKLLRCGGDYDVIWPGHHSAPVSPNIPRQFFEAAAGLLTGTLCGVETQLPTGRARLLEYEEIGVEYNASRDE